MACVATVFLLWKIFQKLFSVQIAFLGIFFYISLVLTNSYAICGRGYSLGIFFLVLAVYSFVEISDGGKMGLYFLWAVSLWLGLYTVITDIYWVLIVCLTGGLTLLFLKKKKELLKLILFSAAGAVLTFISYGFLWENMGALEYGADGTIKSNLHVIASSPRACLIKGFSLMKNNKYMSNNYSVKEFFDRFPEFVRNILESFAGFKSVWLFAVFLILFVVIAVLFFTSLKKRMEKKTDAGYIFANLLVLVGFPALIVVLFIQKALPYTRTFTFLGVFFSFGFTIIIYEVRRRFIHFKFGKFMRPVSALFVIAEILILLDPVHMKSSEKDMLAVDAMKHAQWSDSTSFLADEVYIWQHVEFDYVERDGLSIKYDSENPDIVLKYRGEFSNWDQICSIDEIDRAIANGMKLEYENRMYELWIKE